MACYSVAVASAIGAGYTGCVRPVVVPGRACRMGRPVFSSCGDQTRALRTPVIQQGPSRFSFVRAALFIAESLFATLFPADCRICGLPLSNISRLPVCRNCLSSIRPIPGTVCERCGEAILTPFAVPGAGEVLRCGLCRRAAPKFARAVAYGSYEGALRDLIHLLKYDRVLTVAPVLGKMLVAAMARLNFGPDPILVVPVPLYSSKGRERGFNQSDLIVRAALKMQPNEGRFEPGFRILKRSRATRSQIGLTRHQRRENLRGAFVVPRPESVAGREVLVVDDVFTTGTTASECTRVLLRAGASKVWVATVARTLKLEAQGMRPDSPRETKAAVAG